MTRPEKVEAYLLEGKDVTLTAAKKIRVEKTKKERLFFGFNNVDSQDVRAVRTLAENSLLTQFLFLESRQSYHTGSGETSISFPLILDTSYDYAEKCKRADYVEQNKKLEDRHKQNRDELFSVYQTLMEEWSSKVADDERLTQFFRRRNVAFGKLKEEIDELFKSNPKLRKLQVESYQTLSKYSYVIQTLGKLQKATEIVKHAEKNARLLHGEHLILPRGIDQISTALSKLTNLVDFSTESTCLDCWYEKDQMPFMSSIVNTNKIIINESCLNCNGSGIVHEINMTFPSSLNSLLLNDRGWFYEIIIGYLASEMECVKKVFVHKKIQAYEGGKLKKGVEADVSIITVDDKLYLIEVTKQRDQNHIMENITRKIKHFEDAKIPFEKVTYITGGEQLHFYDIPGKARVFQAKHIPNLKEFMEDWINS